MTNNPGGVSAARPRFYVRWEGYGTPNFARGTGLQPIGGLCSRGVELAHGSDLERALALLIAQRRSKLLQHGLSFQVDEREGDLIVTSGDFCAIYFKPSDQPQLVLRRRSQTDDHEVLALAWWAANDKARELGWIV